MPRPLGRLLALDLPLAIVVAVGAIGFARFSGLSDHQAGPLENRYGPGRFDGGPPWGRWVTLTSLSWWLIPVIAALVLAIAFRRWRPRTAFVLAAVATAGYLVLGYPHGPVVLALGLVGFQVAAELTPQRWWPWSLLALPALVTPVISSTGSVLDPGLWGSFVTSLTVVGLAFAVGAARRSRRQAVRVERELQARRYAYQERLRIAADVHDIVGHSLSVITMQAGVALHVMSRRPDQAEESLRAIRATSAGALTELRATLDTFRDPDFDQTTPERVLADRRSPQPGLDRLDDLVDSLAAGGRRVEVTRRDEGAEQEPLQPWPAAVDQAAYRIVQESLTNVVRHADGSDASVEIVRRPGLARLTITDRGPGPAPHSEEGHGIAGMRERARSLGGRLTAGPGPTGGFAVTAELPVPRSELGPEGAAS